MIDVLAISLYSMQQEMARLERISANLANATTPAYKREVASALPLAPDAFTRAMNGAGSPASTLRSGLDASVTPSAAGLLLIQSDTRPGTLKSTGQNLDVALSGPGYFEVSTDAGAAYTRQGGWQLDARGRIVTAQGHPVMGLGGEIVLTSTHPRIDATGQVFDAAPGGGTASTPVAQLKVVRFENPDDLHRLGDGLVTTDQPPVQVTDSELQMRQGFVENSNVNSMQEMTQLIESMRHFESMQKIALGYDEMIGTAVRKLGDLS